MTLRNLDKLIIVIVAAIVLMWVFRRCSGRSAAPAPSATTQTAPGTPVANTQNQGTTATATSQPTAATAPVTSSTPPAPKPTSSTPVAPPAQPKSTGTTMYVVIDSMKLRKEPTLDGQVLQLMRKGDGVTFNGERSKNIYKLKIDDVTYQEPWIKVTTKSGKTGWIYGAGLRAYKK